MAELNESVVLTPEEVAALSPEDKKIYDEIEAGRKSAPGKAAADKIIRDKAAAEGRPLTFQELSQLNFPTSDDSLGSIGAGPKGTVYNPNPTGEAAEKKPDNQEALQFGIYQEYLRQWNYGKRDYATKQLLVPGEEPMTFEEFKPAFSAIGEDQNEISQLAGFSKGQGAAAAASNGASTTTMGGPTTISTVGSSTNLRNPYKPGTPQYEKFDKGKSAYDILFNEFDANGLGDLVQEVKQYIIDGLSPAEFTIKLRASKPYKMRFAANDLRIANGFRAIDESTYLKLEDSYQSIMQNYGLPASYYQRGNLGAQKGFEDLIGGNVDPVTLEDRIVEGQKVTLGSKSIIDTAKQFFPTLTDGDFLAYVLNPKNGLADIKRKVTAVEIGGAALQSGLQTGLTRAEELRAAGVTKDTAQQGFGTIAGGLQRGSQLASIYGEDPYTQTTAETEVFGLAGAQEARKQRQKITGLEKATFGGQTGITSSALTRDRAGDY